MFNSCLPKDHIQLGKPYRKARNLIETGNKVSLKNQTTKFRANTARGK